MTSTEASASPSIRAKVSTGYARLDEALQGGFLAGSMVVLSAPASDEVPVLLRRFLEVDPASLLISRSLSSAEPILGSKPDGVRCLVCSDKPVPPAQNTLPGKGIENLTELSFTIAETINSLQPNRLVVQFLSDVLLRHKALQTRKWLSELLDKFRTKNITALVVLNPYMHSSEEVQAIVDLFNGNIELIEKTQVEGRLRKALVIKWMHGIETAEKEFPLEGLATGPRIETDHVTVTLSPLKEPRWTTPLISRAEELSKLRGLFDSALAGKGNIIALRGEVGVGKTRLMHELGVYAQSRGAIVLFGRATENGLPYGPWIDVARQYISAAPGEVLRRMLGAAASEFVKLVPDITAKLGTIPASKTLGDQQDRVRFFETVTQFFIAICSETPLLLLFDDTQYADQSSLDLLEYFARSAGSLRVLTVCSSPAEQTSETTPLDQVFLKLNKDRMLEDVVVKNLGKPETAEIIKQIFGEQTVSPEFAGLVYQRTGGNPFFVEEVLRSLVQDGTIFRTEKGWDRKPIQDISIPKTVKAALKVSLAKLDQDTVNVMTMAAVMGSEFDFQVLKEATQTEEGTLLDRIEKALSSGLVLEDEHRQGVLLFADSRVRKILLDDLSRLRKTNYHLKIAEAMEKHYAKNLETQAAAIAAHYSEAGNKALALKYSIMAGDRSRSVHAYEEAISDYRRALDLIDLQEGGDQDKATVLEKLANSYNYAGKPQDGSFCFEQALAIFEKANDRNACARAYIGLAKTARAAKGMGPGSREAALVLKRGLKFLGEDFQSFDVAWIYSKLSAYHSLLDEWDEANACAEKALAMGEKTQNFGAVAEALSIKASFLLDTGKLDEGLPGYERAFNLSLKHEQFEEAMDYLHNLSVYTYQRDLAKARELALQNLELSSRVNHILRQASVSLWLSYLDWLQGNWTQAIERSERAFEIKRRLNLTAIIGSWDDAWKGWLLLSTGQLQQAETEIQKALASQEPKITLKVLANLVMGLLSIEHGSEEEARKHLETCVDTFRNWEFTTMPLLHVEALLHLTSIYIREGKPDKALETAHWARRIAEQLRSDAGLAMALQAEASVLLADGEKKAAEDAYLKSLALWEKAGWPYYKAKALVAYAEAVAESQPEESQRPLLEAAEIFRKLGAKRDLEKGEEKLSSKT